MAVLVKTGNGLAFASIKTRNGLAVASMKSWGGLDTTGGGGGAGISFLAAVNGNSGAPATASSSPMDTTGADLLVVVLSKYGFGGFVTLSDNKGNTWNALTDVGLTTSTPCVQIWWSKPTTVGTGHVFTGASSGGGYPSIYVAAFSGVNAVPFDQQSTGVASPASLTPSVANSLLITGMSSDGSGPPYTIDAGFTLTPTIQNIGGVSLGGGLAWLVQAGGPSAVAPTWGGAGAKISAMAVFKP